MSPLRPFRSLSAAVLVALALPVVAAVGTAAADSPVPSPGSQIAAAADALSRPLTGSWPKDVGPRGVLWGDAAQVFATVIVPPSSDPVGTRLDKFDPLTGGAVAEQQSGAVWTGFAAAVDGTSWVSEWIHHGTKSNYLLAQRDDLFRQRRVIKLPGTPSDQVILLPTARGLRVIYTTAAPRKLGGIRVVMVDAKGRIVLRLPQLLLVDDAIVLDNGRILVRGIDRTHHERSLTVSATGRSVRFGPRVSGPRLLDGPLVHTRAGVLAAVVGVDEPGGPGASVGSMTALAADGSVRRQRPLRDMHVPWPAGCGGTTAGSVLQGIVGVSTGGWPLVRATCDLQVGGGGLQPPDLTFEVGSDLRFRRFFPGTYVFGSPPLADGRMVSRDNPGPNQNLSPTPAATYSSVLVPGSYPVTRGARGRLVRRDSHDAVVRITCRRPWGAICSGVIKLHSDGELVASARYALLGRPGALAATLDRHITTSRGLGRHVSVQLTPLPS